MLKERLPTTRRKLAKNPIYFLGWSNLAASRSGLQPTLEHAFSGKILGGTVLCFTHDIDSSSHRMLILCLDENGLPKCKLEAPPVGFAVHGRRSGCGRQNSTCLQTTQVWCLELTSCNSSKMFCAFDRAVERQFGHGADIELDEVTPDTAFRSWSRGRRSICVHEMRSPALRLRPTRTCSWQCLPHRCC